MQRDVRLSPDVGWGGKPYGRVVSVLAVTQSWGLRLAEIPTTVARLNGIRCEQSLVVVEGKLTLSASDVGAMRLLDHRCNFGEVVLL